MAAEKFEDVLKKLGKVVKKPSASKAPEVLAVQLVDDKGKIIKDDTGAAATEVKRDAAVWKTKQLTLLESILEALGGKKKGGKDKEEEGSSLGKGLMASMAGGMVGAGVGGIIGTALAGLGVGAIVAGGVLAAIHSSKMAIKAWGEAEEGKWGSVDKISAGFGAFLGGKKEGGDIWNALAQSGKWALKGMTAGLFFGLPGVIVGGILGAVLGGIMGWIGGQKIANWVDGTVKSMRSIFDMPEALSKKQKVLYKKDIAQLEKDQTSAKETLGTLRKQLTAEGTTYKERIELRKKIRAEEIKLHGIEDKMEDKRRILAESELAHKDKALNEQRDKTRASYDDVRAAERNVASAKLGVFYAEQKFGEGSKEHNESIKELKDRQLALKDTKAHRETMRKKTKEMAEERSTLRTNLDLEHRTAMGNVRLFFKGETDWQVGMMSSFKEFMRFIWQPAHGATMGGAGSAGKLFGIELKMPDVGALFQKGWNELGNFFTGIAKWIYTPGAAATMGGGGTPAKLFGVELKFPDFDIKMPTKEELVAMLPEWMRDIKLPEFPQWMKDFKLPKLEDLTMPDFKLKENWDKFTSSIPQWIKNYIFDPGSSDPGGLGQGTPMKIFGMELKFPSLNISFSGMSDKIMALLPRWLTDPVGYIKDMVKWFPKLGKTDAEKAAVKTAEMKKATEVLEKVEDKSLKDFTIEQLNDAANRLAGVDGVTKADQAELDVIYRELERRAEPKQMGGPVKKGMPYLVGEGTTQGELFIPNSSGMILSAQRTEQILQAGLQRGAAAGGGGGGTTLVNAPVTSVNNSQSHMTNTTISFNHPSAILNTVNAAA